MARCPYCEAKLFRMREAAIVGAQFKLVFVECSECEAPVAVMESEHLSAALAELSEKVDDVSRDLQGRLDALEQRLS